ncbi:hypothetical protein QEV83_07785 [Methylocapsa sp. D3K7]|uniref:hypothetical protein n=1 Tax=Methylocapsa sp. D3K7 TaxID=3041435 RepID=UPI00244E86B3|nr:hypothetical protein [Methylocapsa sp. D3K7]WGJ16132.1 hypothetical protein QEV83_07785 [Methylocapsa sp. D3K7]
MNLSRASAISATVLIGANFSPWIDAAHAHLRQRAQDGVYVVDITTRQGNCGNALHLTISVSGGHVTAVGDTPIESSGQIDQRGIVNLTFQGMDKVAYATGKLADGSGSGTWSSPSLQCAGSWHAIRHN